jgi:hypothetical protein
MATGHHSTGNPAKEPRSGPIKVYSGVFCFGAKMPILEGVLEMVRASHHHTLNMTYGGNGRYAVDFKLEGNVHTFVVHRLRMEIIECSPGDLANLRRCIIRLMVGPRTYWEGPASRLLLEDWLRKELRNIKKGKNRRIDKYLDRTLVSSLGGLEPMPVCTADQVLIDLLPDHSFALSGNLSVRFFLEGIEYRHFQ